MLLFYSSANTFLQASRFEAKSNERKILFSVGRADLNGRRQEFVRFFEDPLRADSGVSGVEENRGT